MTRDEALAIEYLIVRTTYPGQPEAYVRPSHAIVEHYYRRDWDLPFVEPIGKFLADIQRTRAELGTQHPFGCTLNLQPEWPSWLSDPSSARDEA